MEGRAHLLQRRAGELCPRQPIDRELQRVGGLKTVGLPVDHEETAVELGIDRVDAAADHLAAEDERERSLHRVRGALGELALLEGGLQRLEVVVVLDARVIAARQVVRVEQELLLAEPRLHPGVEAGAEACLGDRRSRHRTGQVVRELVGLVAQAGQRGRRQARRDRYVAQLRLLPARLGHQPLDLLVP